MFRKPQGFACMGPERQREIASLGGKASSGAFKTGEQRTVDCAVTGGRKSGGNFALDPERAREAGRLGGEARARKASDKTKPETGR